MVHGPVFADSSSAAAATLPALQGVVSVVSACHCETVLGQATAAGHQDHCCHCTSQSQGPSLRQREVGAAGARGRSNPLAGARGRSGCMRRAGKPVAKARGQSARRSVRTICLLERVDMPLSETRTRSARRQADDCIQWGAARYGGLHKFHQISFGYGQTILLSAQARKQEQYKVARSSS